MQSFLKKIPLPMAGLTLGIASLGNLYKLANWKIAGNVCGVLSTALFLLIIFKCVLTPRHAAKSLEDPIIASVAPTISMTLMILCTYFQNWSNNANWVPWLWIASIGLHFILMLYFILRHLLPPALHWHMIYPSWFVTFVGIGVIPVTSSHFAPGLGLPLFWTSFAIYVIMFPFVLHRIRKFPLPEATKPLLTIVAAPASLCLTGYVSACSKPNMWFVAILLTFAQCLYWGTFAHIQQYTLLSFYSSFAAFTFPLVISATALTRVTTLVTNNALHTFLFALQIVEWIIATFMLIFVTSHYLHFLRHSAVASKRDIAGKS